MNLADLIVIISTLSGLGAAAALFVATRHHLHLEGLQTRSDSPPDRRG